MQVKTIMQVLKLQIAILSASIMFQFTFCVSIKTTRICSKFLGLTESIPIAGRPPVQSRAGGSGEHLEHDELYLVDNGLNYGSRL